MDKIPWQEYIEFEDSYYTATTSLVVDKKNENFDKYNSLFSYLDGYLEVYNKAYHIALAELGRDKSLKEVKQRLCRELSIKSRVADSALSEAKAKIKARRELLKATKQDLLYEMKSLKNKIKSIKKEYKDFRKKNTEWSKPKKKIVSRNRKYRRDLYFLKKKLNKVKVKIENINRKLSAKNYGICCGSKKLLSYRHKLSNSKTKYNTYAEWKSIWDEARIKHIFAVGTTGDQYGSQLVKLEPIHDGYYNLKIAEYRNDTERGTFHEFPVYLSYLEKIVKDTVSNNQTISYYIVKAKNRFYIKPSVKIEGEHRIPYKTTKGCYGIDINNGFLSITKVSNDGRFLKAEDITFEVEGSKEQNIESLTKILLNIHKNAKKEKYSIAIEGINLTNKKITTSCKTMNRILHLFPYTRYVELSKRYSVKIGTRLYLVHPAYTSKIGDEKYREDLEISKHQSAAYVIARRALGFEEKI